MSKVRDLDGQVFGRLKVVEFFEIRKRKAYWNCKCQCGTMSIVAGSNLTTGKVRSCGCLLKEAIVESKTIHGHCAGGHDSRTYKSYRHMLDRCLNPKNNRFERYGGRGIKVCDRWLHSFENFLADMGEAPEGLEIDRFPDNDGNYKSGNCRWATPSQNSRNRRSNVNITINGQTMCAEEWSKLSGIKPATVRFRLRRGWNPERAIFAKPQGR